MRPKRWCLTSMVLALLTWCCCFGEELPQKLDPLADDPDVDERCFSRSVDECRPDDSMDACKCWKLPEDPQSVMCCHVGSTFELKESLACLEPGAGRIRRLHVHNATLNAFNVSQWTRKQLVSLSVTRGHIGSVVGNFPRLTSISCLNLSGNALGSIERRAFVHLYNLSMLDLSHNNLSEVPNFAKERGISLDISDNKPLMCRSLMDAMNNTNKLDFLNGDQTFCLFPKTFNWFNSTELVPLVQVETVNELEKKSCSDNCTCKAQRLDIVAGRPPKFSIMVDCSGKGLTRMPGRLPPNTIALNISNNNITSLDIDDKEEYESIRELDANNNQIRSILSLEGTKFIDNFVALNLRNNRLESLPMYILNNIFDRNLVEHQVHLGHNPLQCNCLTARTLRVWLLDKHKNIPDWTEVECDNFPGTKVIDLDTTKLCHQDQHDWTDYIYYIIAAEVLLLVCLVLKVSYDYWVFKTAGYLPWPANKMPKLPCDWLCE